MSVIRSAVATRSEEYVSNISHMSQQLDDLRKSVV